MHLLTQPFITELRDTTPQGDFCTCVLYYSSQQRYDIVCLVGVATIL